MTLSDLQRELAADPDIDLVGALPESDEIVIRVPAHDNYDTVTYAIPVAAVDRIRHYSHLRSQLLGIGRVPSLQHYSRVVGYYSRVSNWNRSKHAELRDRHRGRYGLDGRRDLPQEELPAAVVQALAGGGCDLSHGRRGGRGD